MLAFLLFTVNRRLVRAVLHGLGRGAARESVTGPLMTAGTLGLPHFLAQDIRYHSRATITYLAENKAYVRDRLMIAYISFSG
jgi:hypothetical protein